MELYILSKQNLKILSICKVSDYQINLDEETNAKSTFTLMKTEGLKKGNFIVVNGLYRQFLFIIDDVQTEKGSNVSTITALDISNIFDRKVIEKNTDSMSSNSIEEFIANTMSENFVNSNDTALNVGYIDINWHTNTQGVVATNAENGLYNFHTFLINCRQYKNIYTDFKFENGRLKINIQYKEEETKLIDTTIPEVTDYNKIHEEDVTAKVTVLIRENGSEYNLYLKTDKSTTTNKDDPDRASGKIEVISVETADLAAEEALNVIKGNSYNHLVEFKIAKTSKLMDITQLHIGRPIRIKTDDDIYDSYISAITLSDENFIYFKSGNLRNTLLDKLKKNTNNYGNKLDKTGGIIQGNLVIDGLLKEKGVQVETKVTTSVAVYNGGEIDPNTTLENLILTQHANGPDGGTSFYYIRTTFYGGKTVESNRCQMAYGYRTNKVWFRYFYNQTWSAWERVDRETERTMLSSTNGTSVTTQGWQDMLTTAISANLSAGKYFCVLSFAISGAGNGMATVRPIINGNESSNAHRCSFPVVNSLVSSGQVSFYTSVTAGIHTIQPQIYSNVNVNTVSVFIEFYKIGEV